MPNCFQLFPIGSNEPATLNSIDEAICNHLGIDIHPTKYCLGWFDSVGFSLATGKDWEWIKTNFWDKDTLESFTTDEEKEFISLWFKMVDFLKENYTPNCFVQIGK